jgi:hypothetical protein
MPPPHSICASGAAPIASPTVPSSKSVTVRTYGHVNRETAVGRLATDKNSLIPLSKECHVRVSFSSQRRRKPEPVNRSGPPAPARETGARHWEGGTLWHVLGSSQPASRPFGQWRAAATATRTVAAGVVGVAGVGVGVVVTVVATAPAAATRNQGWQGFELRLASTHSYGWSAVKTRATHVSALSYHSGN